MSDRADPPPSPRSRLERDPRRRATHLRWFPGALGEARRRERLPDRVRRGADRRRHRALIPRNTAAPACRCRRGARSAEPCTRRAATRRPATPRCTPWERCSGTVMPPRNRSICGASPRRAGLQALGVTEPIIGSDTTAQDPRRQRATTATSSTARRCGPAACCSPT